MAGRDKIAVIIPSFNGQSYWPDLLPQLAAERYADFDLRIIIVDNNSTDGSVAYIREHFPQFTLLISDTNLGYVGANNLGYEQAVQWGASYVYLLNQDTLVEPGWLQPLYDFAKLHSFGSLQSKINLWPAKDEINTVGNVIHYLGFGYAGSLGIKDHFLPLIQRINYASGAGVFLSVSVIQKLGRLFDKSMFAYLEDLDLGWILQIMGYDNYLIPQSQIYHKYEFHRSIKQVYWFERNRLWVMLKNYRPATLVLIFPAWLIMELGQLFFAAINNWLGAKLRSYAWLFSAEAWKNLSAERKLVQSLRQRSDRLVVGEFSGQILFQPLQGWFLKIANIFFNIYWLIVKQLIFW